MATHAYTVRVRGLSSDRADDPPTGVSEVSVEEPSPLTLEMRELLAVDRDHVSGVPPPIVEHFIT